jgi:hypothetical protein
MQYTEVVVGKSFYLKHKLEDAAFPIIFLGKLLNIYEYQTIFSNWHDGPMPIERAKYTFEHNNRLEKHIQIALTDMNAHDYNVVITNYLFHECE